MTITNFPFGLSSFGHVLTGLGYSSPKGNVYFVDYGSGSDGYDGKTPTSAKKTLAAAYALVTTNNYDTIYLIGSSTHVLTAMLTVAKNRLSIVGLDGSPGRRYGQAAKVSLGITGVATNIATMLNTGVRNVFSNINFQNAETVAEGLYCVAEGGEFAQYNSCNFYKSSKLNVTGAAELACNGDSAEFNNCTIGSTANAIVGAIIRPCVTFSRGLASAADGARDVSFRNCIFARKCGDAANNFLYGAEANCIERMLLIENCVFFNPALGTTPDETIEFAADQTDGYVLVKDCQAINVTGIASTGQGVYVTGGSAAATTSCIAVAAT
jgi:hypothetical protein